MHSCIAIPSPAGHRRLRAKRSKARKQLKPGLPLHSRSKRLLIHHHATRPWQKWKLRQSSFMRKNNQSRPWLPKMPSPRCKNVVTGCSQCVSSIRGECSPGCYQSFEEDGHPLCQALYGIQGTATLLASVPGRYAEVLCGYAQDASSKTRRLQQPLGSRCTQLPPISTSRKTNILPRDRLRLRSISPHAEVLRETTGLGCPACYTSEKEYQCGTDDSCWPGKSCQGCQGRPQLCLQRRNHTRHRRVRRTLGPLWRHKMQ